MCSCSVSVILCARSRAVGGAGTVQVAELHGKKEGGVLCLWTQTSVGQSRLDRRHHRQKNNKIRNCPLLFCTRSPLTLQQPAVHEPMSFLHFHSPLFPNCSFCLSLALHLCSLPSISISQTNYPANSLTTLLSQTFLNSFYIITAPLYLVFIWRFLKQMVYWLCNTFIHVSVNMSEVLCTCWGWIQHSPSQRNHTDPLCREGNVKFLSGASRICCCCQSSEPKAFHFFLMRIFFIWRIIQNKYVISPTPNPPWILRRGRRVNINYQKSDLYAHFFSLLYLDWEHPSSSQRKCWCSNYSL